MMFGNLISKYLLSELKSKKAV